MKNAKWLKLFLTALMSVILVFGAAACGEANDDVVVNEENGGGAPDVDVNTPDAPDAPNVDVDAPDADVDVDNGADGSAADDGAADDTTTTTP